MRRLMRGSVLLGVAAAMALPAAAAARPAGFSLTAGPSSNPLNDLFSLGHGNGETPARAPTLRRAQPPLEATPPARRGPGAQKQPRAGGRGAGGAPQKSPPRQNT